MGRWLRHRWAVLLFLGTALPAMAAPPSTSPSDGATWDLFRAIRHGHLEEIKKAIREGADLTTPQDMAAGDVDASMRYTPLAYAYRYSSSPNVGQARARAIIEILLDAGASATELFRAVTFEGNLRITRLLARRAKRLDLKDCDAFVGAVESKNARLVEFLLDRGADPNCHFFGEPPLVFASTSRIVDVLVDHGADLAWKSARSPDGVVGQALLHSTAFPFISYSESENPLYYNAERDAAIARLLARGAPVDKAALNDLVGRAHDLKYHQTSQALLRRAVPTKQ